MKCNLSNVLFVFCRNSSDSGSYLSKDYVVCLVSGGKSGLDLYPLISTKSQTVEGKKEILGQHDVNKIWYLAS